MLTEQTDTDLMGKIAIPASLPKEDAPTYRKLGRRGRVLLRKYHGELSTETITHLVKTDCTDIYTPTRNGTFR